MKFSEYDEKGLLALCWTGQTFWVAAQNHAAMTHGTARGPSPTTPRRLKFDLVVLFAFYPCPSVFICGCFSLQTYIP